MRISDWSSDVCSSDLLARDRDLQSGFTSIGPHRADWHVSHGALPNGETLSRGQAKLTALTCVLAQAEHYVERRGEWPVVLLDDLASELDRAHQQRVLARLAAGQAQVFVTGTGLPAEAAPDRKSVVLGKEVAGRVGNGGALLNKTK